MNLIQQVKFRGRLSQITKLLIIENPVPRLISKVTHHFAIFHWLRGILGTFYGINLHKRVKSGEPLAHISNLFSVYDKARELAVVDLQRKLETC